MTELQFTILIGSLTGIIAVLLSISKQVERLIRSLNDLRIEHRSATGVEPGGMIRARERNADRQWERDNPR